jgi:hypothetical protein
MKKWLMALSVFLIVSHGYGQARKFQDIAGRWDIGGEQNKGATLEIIDSANITLTYMGETKKVSNVKIDFSKNPCWFDFSASDSTSVMEVKSLIEVVGNGILKWQLFIDEDRAPHFTNSKGELLYLRKSRPATSTIAVAGNTN